MSKNRLFSITQFLLKAALVLNGFVILAMGAGFFLIGATPDRMKIKVGPASILAADTPGLAVFALCQMIVISALMFPILTKLLAVVGTASAGDPFTRENGARLRAIGWLLLISYGIQTVTVSLGLPGGEWLAFLLSPWRGLAPVLLFFVVAHIFDQGAEMRSDLEGTV